MSGNGQVFGFPTHSFHWRKPDYVVFCSARTPAFWKSRGSQARVARESAISAGAGAVIASGDWLAGGGAIGDSYVAQAPVRGAGHVESGNYDSGVGDFDYAGAG